MADDERMQDGGALKRDLAATPSMGEALAVSGTSLADSSEAPPDPLKAVGTVAVAAALATTLAAAPVAPDKIHLPDPVPIVQVIHFGADQPAPDQPADQATDHRSVAKKVLKALMAVLLALLTAAGIIFGALKGCAGSIGSPDSPDKDAKTEQVETA